MRLEREEDETRMNACARAFARSQRWAFGRFGPYSALDVYFLDEAQKLAALAEIKTRPDRTLRKFGTVLMNLNKWFALLQCEMGLGLPGFYIVGFADGLYSVRIGCLPVQEYSIEFRGRTDRPGVPNDQSPAIQVPVEAFTRIDDAPW